MAKQIIRTVIGGAAGFFTGGPLGALAGAAGGLAGSFGHKKHSAQPTPMSETPMTMPLPDDQAILKAKKQSLIRQMGRSGRTSTMLTENTDTLGGG